MEHLIETWGYLAVLWGGVNESDVLLILAGFSARRGYLDLAAVMAIAFAGTFVGAQALFYLGRWRGEWLLARFPRLAPRIESGRRLLEQHHIPLILGYRFTVGLRSVIPIAIGMSRIPPLNFLALNLIGAVVWVALFTTFGYLFGTASEALIQDMKHYELWLMAGILAAAVIWWAISKLLKKRKARREA